jgi:tetratricopeptide (TPR) repeat protein
LVLESEAMFKGGGRSESGPVPAPGATSRAFDDESATGDFARPANAPRAAPKPITPEKKAARSSRAAPFVLERRSPAAMVPMRRVWERFGEVVTDRVVPGRASHEALSRAERELELDGNRREAVKKLFGLSLAAGDLVRAESLAQRWAEKEPLDAEAITARADVLAARGDRAEAVRILGGVLDVRPDDIAAQKRLARLARWAGKAALGCRYTLTSAELRPGDATLLADAVRCARETGAASSADELLLAADAATRSRAETRLATAADADQALKGDLRVEAGWTGDADLDLALIDPDGHRVSWLGAPTRAVISARDVTSRSRESLALSGGKPGEYALELVRVGAGERASGELTISVAGTRRRIPFTLDGSRVKIAIAKIGMRSKLVPL